MPINLIKAQVLLIFAGCLGLSLGAYAGSKEAASYYEDALKEYNQKNYNNAEILLKNSIQQDGSYLAAYVLLAKSYLVNGNGAGAEKEIARAMRLGADKQLTLPLLAKALLIQNKYSDLLETIPVTGFDPKLQSTLLLTRGEAYLETRDYEKSLASYQRAQALQPATQEPYLGIAAVYIRQHKYKEAEKQISRALDFSANSAQAWQLKASIQYAQGNFDKALEDYDKSLANEPDLLESLLGRASLYYDTHQLDNALADLEVLTEKYPLEPRVSYLKHSVLKAQGHTKKAKEILSNTYAYLEKIPFENIKNHASLLLLAGAVSYEIKQYEKALSYLRAYVSKFPGEPYSEKLLGSVLLSKEEYREAATLLESLNKKVPNDYQALTLLGSAYMNMRLYTKANDMFEQAIKLRQSAAPAHIQKAFNELSMGKQENAVNELNTLFKRSGDPRSGLMLTTLYMKQKKFGVAEKFAQKVVDRDPEHIVARNILGVIQIELGKFDEARSNFANILSRHADYFPANMNMAKLDVAAGKLDKAESRLQALLEKKSNLSTVMLALSNLAQQSDKPEEALRWAEKAYDADNKNVSAILNVIYLYLNQGGSKKALRIAEDAAAIYSDNIQINSALGECLLANGSVKKARSVFKDVSLKAAFDSEQLFKVAQFQFDAGDVDNGVWSLQKAVDGDPTFTPARHALIESLISLGRLENARKQLVYFKSYKADALYLRLMGDWYSASNDFPHAIKNYEASLKKTPRSDTVIRLFRAYAANRQLDKGTVILRQWLRKDPENANVKNVLAEAYVSKNQKDKAAKLFKEVISAIPNHASALNNLAVINQQQGHVEKALDLARKAQQLAPNNPAFNDTLGWLLSSNGHPEEGILYLRNAHTRATRNGEVRYHIAATLAKLNRQDEALTELNSLLKQRDISFPSRKKAIALQKSLAQ